MTDQPLLFDLPLKDQPENPETNNSKPRLLEASRNQVEMQITSLNDLVYEDHPVRSIWSYVERIDLSKYLNNIQSCEGTAGRPAIDPKILVALWMYAIIEGLGSARVLARYTKEHVGFKWICGNVAIERRTISDFRINNNELFDDMLAQGVAILVDAGAVTLKEIAQDGIRVKAAASKSSFRNKKSLKKLYIEAKERVNFLKKELEEDPAQCFNRQKATKLKAAEARKNKIDVARKKLQETVKDIDKTRERYRKKKLTEEEKENHIRTSPTEPEARIMKLPDGSFHPAYNFQYSVDTSSNVIVGVDVVAIGSDGGLMLPMFNQLKQRYKQIPERYLVDGGFKNHKDIEELSKEGCSVYMPVQNAVKGKKIDNAHQPRRYDSEQIKEWRIRMAQTEAKAIYRKRASTVELVNANHRRRGLKRLVVKGLEKAKGMALLMALVHNFTQGINWL